MQAQKQAKNKKKSQKRRAREPGIGREPSGAQSKTKKVKVTQNGQTQRMSK
jgi:hypothetical protein